MADEKKIFHQKSIKTVMGEINRQYFLPDIQRDFGWEEKRVINLFDSIFNDYPIGKCLVWKQMINNYNDAGYNLYHFINVVKKVDNSGSRLERPFPTGI